MNYVTAAPATPVLAGAWPLVGHALRFRANPLRFLEEARGAGDVVVIQLGPRPAYVVNGTELIRQILLTDPHKYDKGLHYDKLRPMFGNGLSASSGDFHRRQRRLLQPAFGVEQLKLHVDEMARRSEAFMASWQDGQDIAVDQALRSLTLAIVGQSLFSAEIGRQAIVEFERSLSEVLAGVEKRLMAPFGIMEKLPLLENRRFDLALNRMRRTVHDVIGAYRGAADTAGSEGFDLLSALLAARDEDSGHAMTDQQIHDEVMTLMVSGFETTATALAWAAHLVATHPDVQRRLQAEADEVLDGRLPVYADVRRLEYTRRVLAETSRLYPAIPMLTRRPIIDVALGGHRIPAGEMILIPTHPLHRDERYFPDPDHFDPDRWDPEADHDRPRTAYLPFSLGIRGCIGEQFAKAEMSVVLSLLMSHWTLRPTPGKPPVRTEVKATIRPTTVCVTLARRGAVNATGVSVESSG